MNARRLRSSEMQRQVDADWNPTTRDIQKFVKHVQKKNGVLHLDLNPPRGFDEHPDVMVVGGNAGSDAQDLAAVQTYNFEARRWRTEMVLMPTRLILSPAARYPCLTDACRLATPSQWASGDTGRQPSDSGARCMFSGAPATTTPKQRSRASTWIPAGGASRGRCRRSGSTVARQLAMGGST